MLVEMLICASGIIPYSLRGKFDETKLRGPINCRIVCESLTTVLHPILLPKLKWWEWDGVSEPGGEKGHWGWIPKANLISSSWEKSWSEKLRTLKVRYWNEKRGRFEGTSRIQFMSVDQDPSDFASGNFHIVLHDEPPTYAIWRENQARTMRVDGRMLLAMTWPDDPGISVDWIFDEIYDPGQGVNKNKNIEWINLYTTDNPHLNQKAVKLQADNWSDEVKKVRIYGQPIRFSNRIHPNFTDVSQYWCFQCGKSVIKVEGKCSCGAEVVEYNHVIEEEPSQSWPTIYVLDPHPRKPHMMLWAQIDPYDDIHVVAEADVEEDPVGVRMVCDEIEKSLRLRVAKRLIDPNMAGNPSGIRREVSWRDEFDMAGLFCDLASDSDVGRSRINEYLKPEKTRERPRIFIRSTCVQTIFQMKRYVWDDYRLKLEKELKQKPKTKNDDYPTMLKYLLNEDPTFRFYSVGAPVISRYKHDGNRRRV